MYIFNPIRRWYFRRLNNGGLKLPDEVYDIFVHAPHDIMPDFKGPPGFKDKNGRGRDHPRYGRFTYAFARWLQPAHIVEVGTYAGGTSIGWAQAILDNGFGNLICVDNDSYSKGTYPEITQHNLTTVGLSEDQFELCNGNSPDILSELSDELQSQVDIYLVDGDHTYEGALEDMRRGLPMLKPGGYMLIHDVDKARMMSEATKDHPFPVWEAMVEILKEHEFEWTVLKFIRKHLAVIKIS